MAIDGLGAPMSAIQANQLRMDVSANNVANANTDGFQASTVQTSDAAYINDIGQGTRVTGTYAPARPGPVAQAAGGEGGEGGSAISGMTEMSNVDLATEATSQMGAQNAYGVNIAMMQTANEMSKSVLDIMA